MLFQKQPGYCCICGKLDEYEYDRHGPVVCDRRTLGPCWKEFEWRTVLYIMGKPYYPRSIQHETSL